MHRGLLDLDSRIRAYMARSLSLSSEEEFNTLALDLFAAQREANPAYGRLCELSRASEPPDWRQIPAAPTVAFKELELTSLPAESRQRVFHSSGTTREKPSRHFHSSISLALYEDSVRLWFNHFFRSRIHGRHCFFLTPEAASAPHSSLVHMFATLAAASSDASFYGLANADGSWTLDLERLIRNLHDAERARQPVAIFGTAFLIVHLLDELARVQKSLSLPSGSWLIETGGYKGRSRQLSREQLRSQIHLSLGIEHASIFSEYGMSELSSQAYDRADGIFRFPPWARALVVSPETGREVNDGERGLIRVVDLANVWSIAAVQTEDLAIRAGSRFALRGRATTAEPRGCSLMSA